ncbi:MAG: hypothetical protein ACTIJ7_02205 [Agrococcus casei]|uniref:hypothetical protein n=1 Tax=Agrococcus casei TaxID=343512 RepID=UPI003F938A76
MPDPRPQHRRAQASSLQPASGAGAESPGMTGHDRFQQVTSWVLIAAVILTIVGFAMTLLYSAFADSVAFFDSFAFEYSAALPFLCLPLAAIALVLIVVSSARQKSKQRR